MFSINLLKANDCEIFKIKVSIYLCIHSSSYLSRATLPGRHGSWQMPHEGIAVVSF